MHDVMPMVDYPILAEGDSWFSTNGLPGDNLLRALSARSSSMILSFANPGDEIEEMRKGNSLGHGHFMQLLLKEKPAFWRALLISGGGNDLITHLPSFIRTAKPTGDATEVASYINTSALRKCLARIEDGLRRLANMRNGTPHNDMPIIVHTYDLPMPRNAAAQLIFMSSGPWIKPVLERAGVPDGMQPLVSDFIFKQLTDLYLRLADQRLPGAIRSLYVCKTHGVLTPADPASTGCSNDWMDEIHPTRFGYKKIAEQRFNTFLDKVLHAN